MRRTIRGLRTLGGAALLALLAGWLSGRASAQDERGIVKVVPINGTVRIQMTIKPGEKARQLKRVEVLSATPKDNVMVAEVRGDPTSVNLTGLVRGTTKLKLTDADDKVEILDIIVQLDIEYLRTQLRRAVPLSNVLPVAVSDTTVVLQGTVTRAEDIDILLRVAGAIPGYQIISNLRVGGVQTVQLDVVIAQVSRSKFRAMAFNFLTDSNTTFLGSTVGNAVINPLSVGNPGAPFSVFPNILGFPGTPNGQPTNILFGVINNAHGFLGFLQALKTENVSKTLASPTLTTMSGTPGSFLFGGEQAVPIPAGLGQIGVQFEEFGTRLNYLPIVLGNGKIRLEIEPEVSSLSAANGTSISGTIVPGRVTNRTHVTVEMESGQTFAIAGLIQHTVTAAITKTPILGDLPFLGAAFSSKGFTEEEDEVVILVTPHLVDAQDCGQLTKCLPGQETRSPDDFELFLENLLEAPRGPRHVCQGNHYVPAFKNSSNSDLFPCGTGCFSGVSGVHGGQCGAMNGTCGTPTGLTTVAKPGPTVTPTVMFPAPANPAALGEPRPVAMPLPQAGPATLPPLSGEQQ